MNGSPLSRARVSHSIDGAEHPTQPYQWTGNPVRHEHRVCDQAEKGQQERKPYRLVDPEELLCGTLAGQQGAVVHQELRDERGKQRGHEDREDDHKVHDVDSEQPVLQLIAQNVFPSVRFVPVRLSQPWDERLVGLRPASDQRWVGGGPGSRRT